MEPLFNDTNASIIISELTRVELYSAICKKVRTQEITKNACDEAINNFEKDCQERFLVTLLDSRVVKKAQTLLQKYGKEHSIRTLDALQLAACLNENAQCIFIAIHTPRASLSDKRSLLLPPHRTIVDIA